VGLIHSNKAYRSLAKQVFESREGKSFRGHVKKIISPFPEISYGFRTLHMWHGAIKIPCLSTLQNYPGLSLAAA